MTRVCIHQPDFVPWLGFFDRLLDSDIFVVLDDVQFLRRGWHHRDRIKTRYGSEWLTLSVQKAVRDAPINEIHLWSERDAWVDQNLGLLADSYREAQYFQAVFPRITEIYRRPIDRLLEFNLLFLELAFEFLDLRPKIVLSSSLDVASSRTQRLVEICEAVGATSYLTGTGALAYLERDRFEAAGIRLDIQSFEHPVYRQLHGGFMTRLSCLDLFLNCGAEAATILRSCRS